LKNADAGRITEAGSGGRVEKSPGRSFIKRKTAVSTSRRRRSVSKKWAQAERRRVLW